MAGLASAFLTQLPSASDDVIADRVAGLLTDGSGAQRRTVHGAVVYGNELLRTMAAALHSRVAALRLVIDDDAAVVRLIVDEIQIWAERPRGLPF